MPVRLLFALSIAASVLASTNAAAVPRLDAPNLFLPFVPGTGNYDRQRGSLLQQQTYVDFGDTLLSVSPTLDILPHDDDPNFTARVEVTISESDPTQNPSGTITVTGKRHIYTDLGTHIETIVTEDLQFGSNATRTTDEHFDEVTSISTSGLGMNVVLDVAFYDGHEQEVDAWVSVLDINKLECIEYLVRMNGLDTPLAWDPVFGCGTARVGAGVYRGVYFPVDADIDETDAIFYATGGTNSWLDFIQGFPTGAFYFDVTPSNDIRLRPLITELVRISDEAVVDRARTLFTIAIDPFGYPSLKTMLPTVTNPGAFTQLSPDGLSKLDATHADTLPYPISPSGTQPRLSVAAIARSAHDDPAPDDTGFDLSSKHSYWLDARGGGDPEWQGHLAYQHIFDDAEELFRDFLADMEDCTNLPDPVAAGLCAAQQLAFHCVRTPPKPSDFRVLVDGLTTYFDPAFPDNALVIGDVKAMDLEFGVNEIEADFTLFDLDGKMEGVIESSDVRIIYNGACPFRGPAEVVLSDFEGPNTKDWEDFLQCPALNFSADSATLADSLRFDIVADGEFMHTPFEGTAVEFDLAGIAGSATIGTCSEDWMSGFLTAAIEGWAGSVEHTLQTDWMQSPSQDEALNRLLSPLELGIAEVNAPPPGTPTYSVHPLDRYRLKADFGKTATDLDGPYANDVDGLYLPYLTRSSATAGIPFPFWFCPVGNGQECLGLLDQHHDHFQGGIGPDGEAFDVALHLTTAHLNQALRAQSRRSDRLGSATQKVTLSISDTAVVDTASDNGFGDLVDSLEATSDAFGIRYFHAAAPFTVLNDPDQLLRYVVPNIVVEVVSIDATAAETVHAKILVDVVDRDLSLSFREDGAPTLDARFGDLFVLGLTTQFAPDCTGQCAADLRDVVLDLLTPTLEIVMLEMIENMPTPQLFDSGQESSKPRHLANVRTIHVNQGVNLFADICRPGDDC